MLLSKYEDMLDALDLSSVAKATLNYKNLAMISFLLVRAFVLFVQQSILYLKQKF